MILETDWHLSRIARECGFYDAPQLSRRFGERFGVTPRDFRKRFG